MNFVPSCDSREDAIRSLSEIYAVPTQEIERVLLAPEIIEIAEIYSQINSQGFHFVVWYLLKSSPRTDISYAYYYHSTSYDGCESWFNKGLLSSSQGVVQFLEKIIQWLPREEQVPVVAAAKAIVKRRSEYEGATSETCGPYAWNTLTAASTSPDGIRYRIPEAIQDLLSSNCCGGGGLVDLKGVIGEKLKPVVVKFKGRISDMDNYCASLWAYLLSDNGECHLVHTFIGDGENIDRDDIVELININ